MIDKIILSITHSDDYTDYLFMTAALTNRHVVPLMNPSQDEIRKKTDRNSLVLRCINAHQEPKVGDRSVTVDTLNKSIRVLSKVYLDEDGTIDYSNAEMVRALIQEALLNILTEPRNLIEAFRLHFPLLWMKRQRIYDDPKLFFASSGRYGYRIDNRMPVGAILKAMEEDPETFRLRLGGGCNCAEKPLLVDYDSRFLEFNDHTWTLYTWCPVCHAKREIKAAYFQRSTACDLAVEKALSRYDKGQGTSPLTLFDVIDTLQSA